MISKLTFDNREEWLKARRNCIGGSDASAILGMNPYKSNVDLWMEKTGRRDPEDISDKPYVKYGNDAEPLLRDLFALDHPQYQVGYAENNMITNSRYPWAHASLDGWLTDQDGRKGILEIKTTNILQSMQKEKWDHQIPDNYYIQVLWYMGVVEADFAILKAQLKYEYSGEIVMVTKHYKLEAEDVREDIVYLMEKGMEFFDYVKNDVCPPLILPPI